MADPPRRKVVSSTPTSTVSTNPTASTGQPRVRAKVDLSNITTTTSRPTLRSTPSSTSVSSRTTPSQRPYSPASNSGNLLFNQTSAPATPNAARSPLPSTQPTRTLSTPSTSTPGVIRARPTPIQRAGSSSATSTPANSSTTNPRATPTGGRPTASRTGSSTTPSAVDTAERTRARVKVSSISLSTPINASTARSRSPIPNPSLSSPLLPTPHPATAGSPSERRASDQSSVYSSSDVSRSSKAPNNTAPPDQPASALNPAQPTAPTSPSSAIKQASALPPRLFTHLKRYIPHPTASCPPSPPSDRPELPPPSTPTMPPTQGYRHLPLHPNAHVNNLYPSTPPSPELKTIGLPAMTPRRGSEASEPLSISRGPSIGGGLGGSGSDIGIGLRFDPESGRASRSSNGVEVQVDVECWSGSTAVEGDAGDFTSAPLGKDDPGGAGDADGTSRETAVDEADHRRDPNDQTADDVLAEDAEEAKVNRKIADLEISNASLMAINRSLEAAKAKQRAEIIKLRRALRESTDGPLSHPQASGLRPMLSPSLQSPSAEEFDEGYASEEMDDPELEERWGRVQELVTGMQKRADVAVKKGFEEIKVGQKVLAWSQLEGEGEGDVSADLTPATGTPDG